MIKQTNLIKRDYDYRNRKKQVLQNKLISFRPTNKHKFLIFDRIDRKIKPWSRILWESLELWILKRDKPEELMKQLKTMYPEKWKYINRKQ